MGTDNSPAPGTPASWLQRMLTSCLQALRPTTTTEDPPGGLALLTEDDPELNRLGQRFSNELFARLLLELPAHRKRLSTAYTGGNLPGLRDNIHQLLGATAYCDAPELDAGLRELRQALESGDTANIEQSFTRAIGIIDAILCSSGCHGGD